MSILKKRNILKLAAIFMLVGMMAGAFAMHTKAAVAAPATACDPATEISVGGTCTLLVSATNAGNLLFSNSVTVNVGAVNIGTNTNPFTFASTVIDSRVAPTGGWRLQATSPGLVNTTDNTAPNIPITIGDTGSTCTINTVTCAGFTPTSITLGPTSTSAQTFAAEDTTTDGPGTFVLSTAGNFNVANNTPGGSYSATITLSALASFT